MNMTHTCKLCSFFCFEPKADQAKLFESRQHNRAKYIFVQRQWFSKTPRLTANLLTGIRALKRKSQELNIL